MHTIKPLDVAAVEKACLKKLIVTVEEHSRIGGLGSAVAEALALKMRKPPQRILGTQDNYPHAGDCPDLLAAQGLVPERISEDILNTFKALN
jgi:transketolase